METEYDPIATLIADAVIAVGKAGGKDPWAFSEDLGIPPESLDEVLDKLTMLETLSPRDAFTFGFLCGVIASPKL